MASSVSDSFELSSPDNVISFIEHLNNFISQELVIVDSCNSDTKHRDRFLVFKQAFSKIIGYAQVYKSILSNIKKDYEIIIDDIETRKLERNRFIKDYTKSNLLEATLENLYKRRSELNTRLNQVKQQNDELIAKLNRLKEENEKYRPKKINKYSLITSMTAAQDRNEDEPSKIIKGLDLDEATNLEYLSATLKHVEEKIKELSESQSYKYGPKQQKYELETQLFEKIQIRDDLKIESRNLKNRIYLLKQVLKVANEYYSIDYNDKYKSIEDAITKTLMSSYLNRQSKADDESDFEDGRFLEAEAEMILDYIEKFNDLFDNDKIVEAAYYAAASPKNILRDIETMYRFKNLSNKGVYNEHTDPLMIYCIAIIETISDDDSKPNADMSVECIRIALKYGKLELLTKWIAQKKLTFSYQAAKSLEEYARFRPKNVKNTFELALFIYSEIKASLEMATCLIKLERFSAAIEIMSNDKSISISPEVIISLLKENPTLEFSLKIADKLSKNCLIPFEKIVSALLDSKEPENGIKFLKAQIESGRFNEEELEKLKLSYETLLKFSFLIQDEEQFSNETESSKDHLQSFYVSTKISHISAENVNKTSEKLDN